MRILGADEMREVDRRTVESGRGTWLELMERAGRAVAECALELYPAAQQVAAVCGKGNNGGDGLVSARVLAEKGRDVHVLLCAPPAALSREASAMFEKLGDRVKVHVLSSEGDLIRPEISAAMRKADVILDALLGSGFQPPVRDFYLAVIDAVNAAGKPVVAIDLPSGADADAQIEGTSIRASAIVTFTAPKPWHVWSPNSEIQAAIADIGSPEEVVVAVARKREQLFTSRDVPAEFFVRPADSNKGRYGHVLVIGGSLGKAGAPAMCAMAALRSGAGLVTAASPGSVLSTVASFAPEIMTEPLDGREAECVSMRASGAVRELAKNKSVLAAGPGLGRAAETESFLHTLIAEMELPLVLDADGLNAFEGREDLLRRHRSPFLVITPHPGEMARLTGLSVRVVQADRIGLARSFASEHRCAVVLKGWRTVIAFADGSVWINPTGNAAMSKGGTGDVLTGMISAMVGQMPRQPELAVLAAVYLHGLAGDIALPEFGMQGMLASDLISTIPKAFIALSRERSGGITWLHKVHAQ